MKKIIKNINKCFIPNPECFGEVKELINPILIVENGKIAKVLTNYQEKENFSDTEIIDAEGLSVLPGFVDSHAHPVFAATREDEFEMRNMGKSYLEIAATGGGIKNSVRKLRKMSEDELYAKAKVRIQEFLEYGTTTLEAKSGYGLTMEDELKMLRVIKRLNEELPIKLVPTFLGAHEIPEEYTDNREGYIKLLIEEMLPAVAKEKLAEACDIFIEKNVYTIEEGRRILTRAKELGLDIKIHADQLTPNGGSLLAAELDAVSSDHLEFISDEAIEKMIEKKVIFNLLPGATFFVGIDDYPPARKIIEKGGICSLATDYNPGSCHIKSMPAIMTISAIKMKMTAKELLWAATIGGAKALRRGNKLGTIQEGYAADLIFSTIETLQQLPYNFGSNTIKKTMIDGEFVL